MNKCEGKEIKDEKMQDQVKGNYNHVGDSQGSLGKKLVNLVFISLVAADSRRFEQKSPLGNQICKLELKREEMAGILYLTVTWLEVTIEE